MGILTRAFNKTLADVVKELVSPDLGSSELLLQGGLSCCVTQPAGAAPMPICWAGGTSQLLRLPVLCEETSR